MKSHRFDGLSGRLFEWGLVWLSRTIAMVLAVCSVALYFVYLF